MDEEEDKEDYEEEKVELEMDEVMQVLYWRGDLMVKKKSSTSDRACGVWWRSWHRDESVWR